MLLRGSEIMENVPEVSWLWEEIIPRKFITILASRGGVGKSGFALWLADMLTGQGMTVLYVDAERCGSHIVQRAKAWQLHNFNDILFTSEKLTDQCVETAEHKTTADLQAYVIESKADLVILDSLTILARKLDMNKRETIAQFFEEITGVANHGNAGILLLAHTKKVQLDNQELNIDSIAGSGAITDLARSVLLMEKGLTETERIIHHIKSNFAAPVNDITFDLTNFGIKNLQITRTPSTVRLTGSDADLYRNIAVRGLSKGITLREAREELKKVGASPAEYKRALDYASNELNIQWIK